MKKIFFMAVSAVLLAAGCQKTEIQNEVIPQIGFKTQMGKLTKNPDAEKSGPYDNLVEQDFRVWGYFVKADDLNYKPGDNYFGPNPADGIDVATDLGADNLPVCNTGDNVYYWPGKNKELDLYAVSLWNNQTGTDVNTYNKVAIDPTNKVLTVTNFVVNNDADDDLMVAPLIRQDQDDSEFVQPNFKHALTKVLVNFKSSIETGVYVVSAKITGVKNSGTLTVTNTLPTPEPESGVKVAEALFAWAPNETTTDYTAVCKKAATGNISAAKPGQNASTYSAVAIDNSGYLTYGSWLLIPHENTIQNEIVTKRGIEGIKLVVDYIVDGIYVSQTFELAPANATVTEWGINKQTSYNVLISPEYITFEPEVQDWTDSKTETEPRGDYEAPAQNN